MQNFEKKNQQIRDRFIALKQSKPDLFKERLKLSWSNWGFGMEPLEDTLKRLHNAGIRWIELHGNHYGDDLGYNASQTLTLLEKYKIQVSGICGMFSHENDLSSNRGFQRQGAIDYIRRELVFAKEVGAHYMLVVPGDVGRPDPYDSAEFLRSVQTLQLVADEFLRAGVKAAIEPIRAAEVSFIHTIKEAKAYIEAVNHAGVRHINGDTYHMQTGEAHVGEAILEAGDMLVNLHIADSNRCALGEGSLDLDTVIMALYLIDYNQGMRFVTPEPLGPGGAPYPAMHGMPDSAKLDKMVGDTVRYFREREEAVLGL